MAIESKINNRYVKPADAKAAAKSSYESGKIGTTKRGTAIVDKNSGMNKDSFLKLLVAQMKNMDPSQNQDSSAYVTQMAQFASIEQANNLNTTMKDFANEQMVGKVAIINELDKDGQYKYGLVNRIVKSGTETYAVIQNPSTGSYDSYKMSQIIGTSDSGYTSANYETALNSSFSSASVLASDKALAVYVETKTESKDGTENGQNVTITTSSSTAHKCRIEKAYLDKQNNQVNVTIQFLDDKGNPTGDPKTVNYETIAVAGKELSADVINETIKNNTIEPHTTSTKKVTDTSSLVDKLNKESDSTKTAKEIAEEAAKNASEAVKNHTQNSVVNGK